MSGRQDGKGKSKSARRKPAMPPRESELWPIWCRGDCWDPRIAPFYVGRCQMCEHACHPSELRRWLDSRAFLPAMLLCTEHPASPGQLREVMPTETCRHFRTRREERPRIKRKGQVDRTALTANSRVYKSHEYRNARRIKLSGRYFVLVSPEDFAELSRHKWSASNKRGMVYAVGRKNGRTVYMHREIMKARKGLVVDHKNCRTWDNRRCNLRVCTPKQNQANRGPRGGSSQYVGVLRRGDAWEARISYRGKLLCLGRYNTQIEAAKARDRKAYELHGPFAYLNFPEDYGR